MAEIQVGHDVGVGNKNIRMQKAQSGGLHRAADVKHLLLDNRRQIGHHRIPDAGAARAVENQPKGPWVSCWQIRTTE